jgi:hypothetical protein
MELEQQAVSTVASRVEGSSSILRRYHLDRSSGVTLATAVDGVSACADELLALAEERQQREARRVAKLKQHPEWEWMRSER